MAANEPGADDHESRKAESKNDLHQKGQILPVIRDHRSSVRKSNAKFVQGTLSKPASMRQAAHSRLGFRSHPVKANAPFHGMQTAEYAPDRWRIVKVWYKSRRNSTAVRCITLIPGCASDTSVSGQGHARGCSWKDTEAEGPQWIEQQLH